MSLADDIYLLKTGLGWSNEVRHFGEILTRDGRRGTGEARRAGETILRLLPDVPTYRPYRAAIARLLEAERAATG